MEYYKKMYEEAFERAKYIYNDDLNSSTARAVCEQDFPELKESEDERIRKELIEHIKANCESDFVLFQKFSPDNVIAWLERQGEQKLTDKVESKFKVGDWIVRETFGLYKIIEICKSWYEVIDIEDNYNLISFDNEHTCHLWTIQDAKDGDVLVLNNEYFLFKDRKNSIIETYTSYCFVDSAGTFRDGGEFLPVERGVKIFPSTKEQRNLLFQKMKEAGYEWDAEKKELKEIEPKSSWSKKDD